MVVYGLFFESSTPKSPKGASTNNKGLVVSAPKGDWGESTIKLHT